VSGCKVSLKETFEASQTLRPHAEPINERKPRNWLVFTFIRFNVRGADPAQLFQNESQGKDRERDSLSCAGMSAPSNVRFDAPPTPNQGNLRCLAFKLSVSRRMKASPGISFLWGLGVGMKVTTVRTQGREDIVTKMNKKTRCLTFWFSLHPCVPSYLHAHHPPNKSSRE
jgi:hypothetical protein